MPTFPVSEILIASVIVPDLIVEKASSPLAVSKFWVRIEVMAAVEVALVRSFALNVNLEAVEVAEAKLERYNWSTVAPLEVFTTSNFVWGEVVPMPSLEFPVSTVRKLDESMVEGEE